MSSFHGNGRLHYGAWLGYNVRSLCDYTQGTTTNTARGGKDPTEKEYCIIEADSKYYLRQII